jgi:peptidoglycan-N-acetylmuramic acid deacetylase
LKLTIMKISIPILAACSVMLSGCSDGGDNSAETRPPETAAAVKASPGQSVKASPAVQASPSAAATPAASPGTSVNPSISPSITASVSPALTPKPTVKPVPASGDSSRNELSWYYMKKKSGEVPGFPNELKQLKPNQKAAWVGAGKKIYLTFDTGGPLGESDKLLQILKDNDVKAAFFLVGYNVKQYKDFTKKVAEDGHLIGNHTMSHKDMTTLSDEEVKKELHDFSKLIQDVTGKPVAPLFRFPYGKYSMHLLDLVSEMGYTSVFWSTAMRDWEPRAGGAEDAYKDIMKGLHDGNVILMHQGSKENIEALDRIIKDVKKAGYEFASLEDLMK